MAVGESTDCEAPLYTGSWCSKEMAECPDRSYTVSPDCMCSPSSDDEDCPECETDKDSSLVACAPDALDFEANTSKALAPRDMFVHMTDTVHAS